MRILFAGTPDFAATALAAIVEAGLEVVLVLSQPDRPAGRGMKLVPSPVKALAQARGIDTLTPQSLSLRKGGDEAAAAHQRLRAADADVLVVAAYGLILPQAVLDIPRGLPDAGYGRLTALNIHASLLPRWRGAAPVARAIEAGDSHTGITIMQMDAGLDTGPMVLAESIAIEAADSTGSLSERLARLGARLIISALREAAGGRLRAVPQPAEGVTYAHKLGKGEAWLDFALDAETLARKVHAFDPFPGACALAAGATLKFWRAHAEVSATGERPGTVLGAGADGLHVACRRGTLVVTELQRPGSRRMSAREFFAGYSIGTGTVLEAPGAKPPP